jgi:hypothetical protein
MLGSTFAEPREEPFTFLDQAVYEPLTAPVEPFRLEGSLAVGHRPDNRVIAQATRGAEVSRLELGVVSKTTGRA